MAPSNLLGAGADGGDVGEKNPVQQLSQSGEATRVPNQRLKEDLRAGENGHQGNLPATINSQEPVDEATIGGSFVPNPNFADLNNDCMSAHEAMAYNAPFPDDEEHASDNDEPELSHDGKLPSEMFLTMLIFGF
jgi:hypothetical protein